MVAIGDKSQHPRDWYINANYIPDLNTGTPKQFIATQGPIEKTMEAFWHMVWRKMVVSIVMLCGLEEHGRVSCHVYYPTKGEVKVGNSYSLKLLETIQTNDFYIIRKIQMTNLATSETRVVDHYHVRWLYPRASDGPTGRCRSLQTTSTWPT